MAGDSAPQDFRYIEAGFESGLVVDSALAQDDLICFAGFMLQPILRKIKRAQRWVTDASYRHDQAELRRLRGKSRYESTTTTLLDPPVRIVDPASFLSAYQAIFEKEIYAFRCSYDCPVIIDGGANIGLATLYWKHRFPDASITAFEPDPDIFDALRWNIEKHGHDDVTLMQKGLWSSDGTLEFTADGADGGHLRKSAGGDQSENVNTVSVTRLREYLGTRVDLLKLDIEGAETEVLLDSAGALGSVQHLFVEYHSYVGQEQRIDEMLRVLRNAGFRLHIQPELVAEQPFVEDLKDYGMDHRLNIFAYRK
jgi:FkbM family methyltransferase